MFEIPSSKHQIPNKFEIPNPKVPSVGFCHIPARGPRSGVARFGIWSLGLVWDLEFGSWLRLDRVRIEILAVGDADDEGWRELGMSRLEQESNNPEDAIYDNCLKECPA
jgi:hypothetical protein